MPDNNQALVKHLRDSGHLSSPRIARAFLSVDRQNFVPPELKSEAYSNVPLPIGSGQTISQPLTVAFMLELLAPEPGNKVLDIGAGSGWTTALLANLVGFKGHVYAYEIVESVGKFGQENTAELKNVTYQIRDFFEDFEVNAPYDRILSGAAFEEIPTRLQESLVEGGILVAPTKGNDIRRITRDGEEFEEEIISGFVFVPITGEVG